MASEEGVEFANIADRPLRWPPGVLIISTAAKNYEDNDYDCDCNYDYH